MKKEKLLWKYVEGKCSPAEKATVENLLADDLSLQKEITMMQEVHMTLSEMETEQPSMRFSKNVMEALPDIYPSEAVEPLVKPVWKKLFWAFIAMITVIIFILPKSTQPSGKQLPYVDQVTSGVNSIVGQLPTITAQFFVLTLVSLLTLVLIDKIIGKRLFGIGIF